MTKRDVKNENTKIELTLKSIILYTLSIISFFAGGGYAVGYYKASLDAELKILKLNQEHQKEVATLKEEENKLRIEFASSKNKSLEDFISIIKYMKNEKNN